MEQDQPLTIHTFKGRRFDDHGIDLSVLPEFAVYQKLVIETAKEMWRRENPGRDRLQRNFEDDFRLKIFEINEGSVSVPIYRDKLLANRSQLPDLLSRSVDSIQEAIAAVSVNERLPENFPKSVISLFAQYGKTLAEDELIEICNPRTKSRANFSPATRDSFERRCLSSYTDKFDIVAKIAMARVNKLKISVLLDTGEEIEAPLNEVDRDKVLDSMKEFERMRVRLIGRANFSADGCLTKITEIDAMFMNAEADRARAPGGAPFWQRCLEIAEGIPNEVVELIPKDASKNIDKHLYSRES